MPFTNAQLDRYSRNILLHEIGPRGQRKLLDSSVLVIGAGGLGAPASMYLATAGVGTIGIADADIVDVSNLQRQIIHTTRSIGRPKADSAEQTIRSINPDVKVNRHAEFVTAENVNELIAAYDFVIEATDSFTAKFLVNDACVIAGKPFSHAGIMRFRGQVMTWMPGRGPCLRCIFRAPPAPGAVSRPSEVGVLGALAGIAGSVQAAEAIKVLLGIGEPLVGRMLQIDALSMNIRTVKLPPQRDDCDLCGAHPRISEPIEDFDPRVAEEFFYPMI
ncbi:HesA/MoeB/ThiF family protein [Sutterella sp.]|uniref:HesA/MoeB/ThiF family protein n=1 Tax=Sutterella sp. TaxID=1981025 RepID=UPI0026E0E4DE|nr:HesA/MoeB/ThiF family protein [Sutterella sp.]MDO5531468.1 HesA/MoeB/ThiF family protein [Sutterella sp.]